jgi:hypothetical protein
MYQNSNGLAMNSKIFAKIDVIEIKGFIGFDGGQGVKKKKGIKNEAKIL